MLKRWFALSCLTAFTVMAHADTVSYLETISGISGSLGATPFSNATLTVYGVGDPASFQIFDPYRNYVSSELLVNPTVAISGLGTYALLSQFSVSFAPRPYITSIASSEGYLAQILGGPPAANYLPVYTIDQPGSFTGVAAFVEDLYREPASFATSGGALNIYAQYVPSTFAVSAVTPNAVTPEPSSLALFGTGVAGLLAARSRRKANQRRPVF